MCLYLSIQGCSLEVACGKCEKFNSLVKFYEDICDPRQYYSCTQF